MKKSTEKPLDGGKKNLLTFGAGRAAFPFAKTAARVKSRFAGKKILLALCAAFLFAETVFAQGRLSSQRHEGAVSAIASVSGGQNAPFFFSAGDDGFLIKWTADGQGERYQISNMRVRLVAISPDGKTLAAYETDGGGVNRLSVWETDSFARKYARRFSDPLISLSFSARGTYIIAGTAAVDGAIFLRASDGTVVSKVLDSTGLVSYAATSETERTVCMYSPAGNIAYYNMQTGRLSQRIQTESSLEQAVLFCDNLFFAGVKNGSVCIVSALTGETLAQAAAQNPIMLTGKGDKNVRYLIAGIGGATLYEFENQANKSFSEPRIVKNFRASKNLAVRAAAMEGAEFFLGSADGDVFRADISQEPDSISLQQITSDTYEKIYDMAGMDGIAAASDGFYFLTKDAVYRSSYDSGSVTTLAQSNGETNMASYGGGVILWSRGTRREVRYVDVADGSEVTLFTPGGSLRSLRVFENILLHIEGDTSVKAYNFDTQSVESLYTGAGLEDAVILNGVLYVAKSAATNPESALISVNMETGEVAPLAVDGDVIYALSTDGASLYGIAAESAGSVRTTQLFSFAPGAARTQSLLRLSDEDTGAFTYLQNGVIFTNIGGERIYAYTVRTRRSSSYNRSASLPVKVAQSGNRIAALNQDGSVSWYRSGSSRVLADWYLTQDGTWYEF